jgi:hypothetical protein
MHVTTAECPSQAPVLARIPDCAQPRAVAIDENDRISVQALAHALYWRASRHRRQAMQAGYDPDLSTPARTLEEVVDALELALAECRGEVTL